MSRKHGIVPRRAASGIRGGIFPLARVFAAAGISPNSVSVAGFVVSLLAGLLLALEQPWLAALAMLVGSGADALDGQVARLTGQGSAFGAFLDSTLDRLSDAAIFGGAATLGFRIGDGAILAVALWALVASFMVSYTRARAEALARDARVGLAPREARLALLIAGVVLWALLAEPRIFGAGIAITALLATVTVAQRISHVARQR